MLTRTKPGQFAATFLWASKNSRSRPGFTRKRTALKAVMALLPSPIRMLDDALHLQRHAMPLPATRCKHEPTLLAPVGTMRAAFAGRAGTFSRTRSDAT